jgi:hypothetical protein
MKFTKESSIKLNILKSNCGISFENLLRISAEFVLFKYYSVILKIIFKIL